MNFWNGSNFKTQNSTTCKAWIDEQTYVFTLFFEKKQHTNKIDTGWTLQLTVDNVTDNDNEVIR